MIKILSYKLEPDSNTYRCEACIIMPKIDGPAQVWVDSGIVSILYIGKEELDFRLWKQKMNEQKKLTILELMELDDIIDKLYEFYLDMDKKHGEKYEVPTIS